MRTHTTKKEREDPKSVPTLRERGKQLKSL